VPTIDGAPSITQVHCNFCQFPSTLFWLEAGDNHKSEEEIGEVTKIRTGVRLVYAQISPKWVQETVCFARRLPIATGGGSGDGEKAEIWRVANGGMGV
jgi:hypothetical protein